MSDLLVGCVDVFFVASEKNCSQSGGLLAALSKEKEKKSEHALFCAIFGVRLIHSHIIATHKSARIEPCVRLKKKPFAQPNRTD